MKWAFVELLHTPDRQLIRSSSFFLARMEEAPYRAYRRTEGWELSTESGVGIFVNDRVCKGIIRRVRDFLYLFTFPMCRQQ